VEKLSKAEWTQMFTKFSTHVEKMSLPTKARFGGAEVECIKHRRSFGPGEAISELSCFVMAGQRRFVLNLSFNPGDQRADWYEQITLAMAESFRLLRK
jgi:hypothetical protein